MVPPGVSIVVPYPADHSDTAWSIDYSPGTSAKSNEQVIVELLDPLANPPVLTRWILDIGGSIYGTPVMVCDVHPGTSDYARLNDTCGPVIGPPLAANIPGAFSTYNGIIVHVITASAGAHGSITPSGLVSVTNNGTQSFTITPEAGYQVADVLVDGVSVGAVTSYTFQNTTADHTIFARFGGGGGPLIGVDIDPGRGQKPGSTEDLGDGDYALQGGGFNVIDAAGDTFHFAYESIVGDFDKRVRITSLVGPTSWSRGGLQARESLVSTSRVVKIVASNPDTANGGANQVATFVRADYFSGYGDCGRRYGGVSAALPDQWLRLKRVGDNFQMFVGTNGVDWSMIAQRYLPDCADELLVGLYAGANSADGQSLAEVLFESYSNTPVSDNTPPTLVSTGTLDRKIIGLKFSEAIASATATVAANYTISQGSVVAAEVGASGESVYLTVTGLNSDNYTVTVNGVTDSAGNPIAANSSAAGRRVPWVSTDVGAFADFPDRNVGDDPYPVGRAVAVSSGDNPEIEIVAGGSNIWNSADDMHFIYQEKTGDFDVQVETIRMDRSVSTASYGHAGLMVRESLYRPGDDDMGKPWQYTAAGTKVKTVMNTTYAEGNQERTAIAIWRATVGGGYGNSGVVGSGTPDVNGIIGRWGNLIAGDARGDQIANTSPAANRWLRLRRKGDEYHSFWSYDGVNWTEYNVYVQEMPATVLVGFASMTDTPGQSATIGINRPAHYATVGIRNFGDYATGLAIHRGLDHTVVITWSAADGVLQTSDSVTGPWEDLDGATSPYVDSGGDAARFYRLKRP